MLNKIHVSRIGQPFDFLRGGQRQYLKQTKAKILQHNQEETPTFKDVLQAEIKKITE